MNQEKKDKSKGEIIKETFKGFVSILPTIERVIEKPVYKQYLFAKLCITIFSLIIFLIYNVLNSIRIETSDFSFFLLIFFLFAIWIFSPLYSHKLRIKESYHYS